MINLAEIKTTKRSYRDIESNLLIVGLFQDKQLNPQLKSLDVQIENQLSHAMDLEKFRGNKDTQLSLYGNEPIKRIMLIGLGKQKNYTTDIYNYHDNFQNEHHIVGGVTTEATEYPLASGLYVNEKNQRVSDFHARTFLMPTSKTAENDAQHNTDINNTPYRRYDPENWVQSRNSQMIQLENAFNINIEVHGNTLINVGDIVTVNLPYTGVVKGDTKYDRFYQGRFLIKTIRHDFNVLTKPVQHTMSMNLVKDSLEEQIFAPDDNYEPSAKESGIIKEYQYA